MADVYSRIYSKLDTLTGGIENFIAEEGKCLKLQSGGYMDLSVENLGNNIISITHYYKQGGDLIPDPDMTVKIIPNIKMAEALTYQDSFGFQRVYVDENRFYPQLKKQLNSFLDKWLTNLKNQGFYTIKKTAKQSKNNFSPDKEIVKIKNKNYGVCGVLEITEESHPNLYKRGERKNLYLKNSKGEECSVTIYNDGTYGKVLSLAF